MAKTSAYNMIPRLPSLDTPQNTVLMDPDADAQAAEQARLERLAKHETVKQALQKHKMVFRGAGKMTTGA